MFTVHRPYDVGDGDVVVLSVDSLEQLRAGLPDVLWRYEKRLTVRRAGQHICTVDGGGIASDELLDRVVELARTRGLDADREAA